MGCRSVLCPRVAFSQTRDRQRFTKATICQSEIYLAMCALMNSKAFGYLVSVQLARTELAQSFEVGLIQQELSFRS